MHLRWSMREAAWLVIALVGGGLAAFGWLKREQWIRRRRERA
jgi:hypothetical protein